MKILAIVASVLGIAFIGALTWALLTTSTLNETRDVLSSTEAKLASTNAELRETEERLADTVDELTDTREDLANTEDELTSTRNELSDTKIELSGKISELSTTRSKLTSTESDLADVKEQLDIARGTLDGLGISLMRSKECYDVDLLDNPEAIDPTWEQLRDFLVDDKTDKNRYILGEYDCSEFSRDVHNNAEAAGIRAAEVHVQWSNEDIGHALNAFLTTDYGLVYIDCTRSPDLAARVVVGKEYRGVNIFRITSSNVRNDRWWDNLVEYYYMQGGYGAEAKTSDIIIFW